MTRNKITKIAILLFCSLAYTGGFVSAQVYKVNGGSLLKIIQSGGNTRSENFRVSAHLKPIGHPDSKVEEDSSSNNNNNSNNGNTSNPSSGGFSNPNNTGSSSPRNEGGERYSHNWILDKKYDQLVKERDDRLMASAPKKELSFLPTDPSKIEKVVEAFNNSSDTKEKESEKISVNLIKDNTEKNNKIEKKYKPKFNNEYVSKKIEINTKYSDNLEEDNLEEDDLYSSANKQVFELYQTEETDCDENVSLSTYFQKNLFIFIFGVLCLFFLIIVLLIMLLAWYFFLRSKEVISFNENINNKKHLNYRKEIFDLDKKSKPKTKTTRKFRSLLSILILITSFCFVSNQSFAETTTPQKIIYEGELFDANGNALTGNYDFRFSLWDNQDFDINDKLMGGDLNTAASDFFGWYEVQTYNIVNNGKFSIQVGTVTPFTEGLFDRINISLQIEVKKQGEPNTSYELIDLDYDNDAIDRMVIDTVPFAFNADKLDFREAGYGIGEIPYLDELGKLPSFLLPNLDAVTFNGKAIGYEADEIPYQDATGKLPNSIIPDIDAVTLDGHDSGYDPGDIPFIDETTGLIPDEIIETGITAGDIPRIDELGKLSNTIIPDIDAVTLDGHDTGYNPGDIPYIDADTGLLPVEILPGGGLGSTGTDSEVFRLDEDGDAGPIDRIRLDFGLNTGKSLAWDIGDDQFELNGDILIDGGIETTGTINGVSIGVHDENHVLSPRYPNSIFEGDGTNNEKGYMYEEEESVFGVEKSILRWMSKDSVLQDYDVIIRYHLVDKFDAFQTPALSFEYLTEGVSSDSRIDLTIEKEGVTGDQLSGSGISLTSNVWTKDTFNFSGGATWEEGDVMIIKIKMYGRTNQSSKISDIIIHTREE